MLYNLLLKEICLNSAYIKILKEESNPLEILYLGILDNSSKMMSFLNLQEVELYELQLMLKQLNWAMAPELFSNFQISLKASFCHLRMTRKCN